MEKPVVVLSASSLARNPACQRALAFTYVTRLRRLSTEHYLTLGRAFHAGIAVFYTYRSIPAAVEAAQKELNVPLDERAVLKAEVERLIQAYAALAPIHDAEDEIRPIAVENRFAIPLHISEVGEAYCVGVIDLYADSKYGPCVIDHKTASSCGPSYFSRAEYDIQANLYMIAAERLGVTANTFIWNVLAKTKDPYVRRFALIPDPRRLQRYLNELKVLSEQLIQIAASYPGRLGESRADLTLHILRTVPGNPGACRHCPFASICEYPEHILDILESEYTVSTYDEWGITCNY